MKSKIFLLDSSTITLCLSLFDWARYTHEKGAVKLHTLLDYEGKLPACLYITDGSKADNTAAYGMPVPCGSIVVVDRVYMDFSLFEDWDSRGTVLIQLWTAMISMLMLKFLKAESRYGWHLSNLMVFIRLNLFVKLGLISLPQSSIFRGIATSKNNDTGVLL